MIVQEGSDDMNIHHVDEQSAQHHIPMIQVSLQFTNDSNVNSPNDDDSKHITVVLRECPEEHVETETVQINEQKISDEQQQEEHEHQQQSEEAEKEDDEQQEEITNDLQQQTETSTTTCIINEASSESIDSNHELSQNEEEETIESGHHVENKVDDIRNSIDDFSADFVPDESTAHQQQLESESDETSTHIETEEEEEVKEIATETQIEEPKEDVQEIQEFKQVDTPSQQSSIDTSDEHIEIKDDIHQTEEVKISSETKFDDAEFDVDFSSSEQELVESPAQPQRFDDVEFDADFNNQDQEIDTVNNTNEKVEQVETQFEDSQFDADFRSEDQSTTTQQQQQTFDQDHDNTEFCAEFNSQEHGDTESNNNNMHEEVKDTEVHVQIDSSNSNNIDQPEQLEAQFDDSLPEAINNSEELTSKQQQQQTSDERRDDLEFNTNFDEPVHQVESNVQSQKFDDFEFDADFNNQDQEIDTVNNTNEKVEQVETQFEDSQFDADFSSQDNVDTGDNNNETSDQFGGTTKSDEEHTQVESNHSNNINQPEQFVDSQFDAEFSSEEFEHRGDDMEFETNFDAPVSQENKTMPDDDDFGDFGDFESEGFTQPIDDADINGHDDDDFGDFGDFNESGATIVTGEPDDDEFGNFEEPTLVKEQQEEFDEDSSQKLITKAKQTEFDTRQLESEISNAILSSSYLTSGEEMTQSIQKFFTAIMTPNSPAFDFFLEEETKQQIQDRVATGASTSLEKLFKMNSSHNADVLGKMAVWTDSCIETQFLKSIGLAKKVVNIQTSKHARRVMKSNTRSSRHSRATSSSDGSSDLGGRLSIDELRLLSERPFVSAVNPKSRLASAYHTRGLSNGGDSETISPTTTEHVTPKSPAASTINAFGDEEDFDSFGGFTEPASQQQQKQQPVQQQYDDLAAFVDAFSTPKKPDSSNNAVKQGSSAVGKRELADITSLVFTSPAPKGITPTRVLSFDPPKRDSFSPTTTFATTTAPTSSQSVEFDASFDDAPEFEANFDDDEDNKTPVVKQLPTPVESKTENNIEFEADFDDSDFGSNFESADQPPAPSPSTTVAVRSEQEKPVTQQHFDDSFEADFGDFSEQNSPKEITPTNNNLSLTTGVMVSTAPTQGFDDEFETDFGDFEEPKNAEQATENTQATATTTSSPAEVTFDVDFGDTDFGELQAAANTIDDVEEDQTSTTGSIPTHVQQKIDDVLIGLPDLSSILEENDDFNTKNDISISSASQNTNQSSNNFDFLFE